jgi:hypothetical protein
MTLEKQLPFENSFSWKLKLRVEPKTKSLETQATAIAREVSMLMIACDIDIHQDQIAKRVLQNDVTVCGRKNHAATLNHFGSHG